MTTTAPYKPSPLSFGSPRSSPFRRPESPASPSPAGRIGTPPASPPKALPQTPTHHHHNPHSPSKPSPVVWNTPQRGMTPPVEEPRPASLPASPTRMRGGGGSDYASGRLGSGMTGGSVRAASGGDAMSKLSTAQVRELREGYQLLDRGGEGQVGREDVMDMLKNLGQDSSPNAVAAFFPSGSSQSLSLPAYLSNLSNLLAPLSPPEELLAAFSAFDDDDNGQVDVAELRDALLNTAPDTGDGGRMFSEAEVDKIISGFTGRKTFGKMGRGKGIGMGGFGNARGEVFKYQDFVGAVNGGGAAGQEGKVAEVKRIWGSDAGVT